MPQNKHHKEKAKEKPKVHHKAKHTQKYRLPILAGILVILVAVQSVMLIYNRPPKRINRPRNNKSLTYNKTIKTAPNAKQK